MEDQTEAANSSSSTTSSSNNNNNEISKKDCKSLPFQALLDFIHLIHIFLT